MGKLIHVPFVSYHNLNKWFMGSSSGEVRDGYYEGMRNWLGKYNPVISIFDYGEGTGTDKMLDIQMEFEIGGERDQVFLMTLVTSKDVEENATYMNDVPSPFYAGPIIWPREYLTRSDILDAVRSWSLKWWPDFKVSYQFSNVAAEPDLDDDYNFTHRLCVVTRNDTPEIRKWAKSKGCIAIEKVKSGLILIGLPVQSLSELEKLWPDVLDYYEPMIP